MRDMTLRYMNLRVLDLGRVSRLAASIAQDGQRSPVLVTPSRVLVDGYHRVEALRKLGRDVVTVVELPVGEAEALVLAWRLETGRRKSALEEGWLLRELAESHGRTVTDLAAELRRPKSWVSQRLGLVRVLPEAVQRAVRKGRVPAQAAMKSLVPMARIDGDGCARLVAALKEPVTVRQVERIYAAWRKADPEGRARIEAAPHLLLKVEESVAPVPPDAEEKLAADLERITGLCHRARREVRQGVFARANTLARRTWEQAREAFDALREEVARAGS